MPVSTKVIKNRISSVKNTKKITKAMQMIAAVKMRKSTQAATNSKMYTELSQKLIDNLGNLSISHPLLEKREVKNILLVVITSNRGLCGSYNANVLKEASKFVKQSEKNIKILAVGKKAAQFARKNSLELFKFYDDVKDVPSFDDSLTISSDLMNHFETEEFDEVYVAFTKYISGLSQIPEVKQVLPFSDKSLNIVKTEQPSETENNKTDSEESDYKFEPEKNVILEYLVPKLIKVQVYQSMIDSLASEHSSRMVAMKNATDSASDMIDSLTLEYNKNRQAAITREISEIVSGAEAL